MQSRSSHCSINSASEAMAASDDSANPLIIVISGPGGVGKTRLALRVVGAHRLHDLAPVAVVELTRRERPGEPTRPTSSPITPSSRTHRRRRLPEWTKFLDNYYGTRRPMLPRSRRGVGDRGRWASQVKKLHARRS